MTPFTMSREMIERLPDRITTDSSHIATLQLPGINKKSRKIHIFPKARTAPLILLGVLCYDGCTITIDQQEMTVQKMDDKY